MGWPGNDVGEKIEDVYSLEDCRKWCEGREGASRFTWRGPKSKPTSNRNSCYCKNIEEGGKLRRKKGKNVFSGLTECCESTDGGVYFHHKMQCEDGSCEYRSMGMWGDCANSEREEKSVLAKHCGHLGGEYLNGKIYWSYRCDNGQCITQDKIENNYRWAYGNGKCECADGSDEENPQNCPELPEPAWKQ